jgi:hypothetical protein
MQVDRYSLCLTARSFAIQSAASAEPSGRRGRATQGSTLLEPGRRKGSRIEVERRKVLVDAPVEHERRGQNAERRRRLDAWINH